MGLDILVVYGEGESKFDNADNEAGYLRFNWAGVAFMGQACQGLEIKNPFDILFPGWNGYNGEEILVTPERLQEMLVDRDNLRQWLRATRVMPTNSTLGESWDYFVAKLEQTAKLVDYIEMHRDAPGLTVYFG